MYTSLRRSDSYSGQPSLLRGGQVQAVVGEGETLAGGDLEGTGAGQAVVGELLRAVFVREQHVHEVTHVTVAAADQW